jgi:HD superfamily phosphodiesterase
MIAEKEGSDKKVISWFAYLHDARRENDDDDPGLSADRLDVFYCPLIML